MQEGESGAPGTRGAAGRWRSGEAASFSLRKTLGRGTGLRFMNLLSPVFWCLLGSFLKLHFAGRH